MWGGFWAALQGLGPPQPFIAGNVDPPPRPTYLSRGGEGIEVFLPKKVALHDENLDRFAYYLVLYWLKKGCKVRRGEEEMTREKPEVFLMS